MGGQVSPTGTAEVRPVAVSPPTMLLVAALACVTFAEGALLGVVPTTVAGLGRLFGQSAGTLTWVSTAQLLAAGARPVPARGGPAGCRRGGAGGAGAGLRAAAGRPGPAGSYRRVHPAGGRDLARPARRPTAAGGGRGARVRGSRRA